MLHRTTLVLLLALALIAGACASESVGDPKSEGIQVHAHWTIDVRGSDGSIEERREFDNALLPEGQAQLIVLLTGECKAIDWGIQLWGDFLPEGSDTRLPGSITINSVDVSRESNATGLLLRLSGSANREDAFFLDRVKTRLALDNSAPDADFCGIRDFSGTAIDEFEIPANKTVDVVVEFRFS